MKKRELPSESDQQITEPETVVTFISEFTRAQRLQQIVELIVAVKCRLLRGLQCDCRDCGQRRKPVSPRWHRDNLDLLGQEGFHGLILSYKSRIIHV